MLISLIDKLPSVIDNSPKIADKKVDLPAPTEPITPKNSPYQKTKVHMMIMNNFNNLQKVKMI